SCVMGRSEDGAFLETEPAAVAEGADGVIVVDRVVENGDGAGDTLNGDAPAVAAGGVVLQLGKSHGEISRARAPDPPALQDGRVPVDNGAAQEAARSQVKIAGAFVAD